MSGTSDRAIFFDRDGVINQLVPRADGRNTSPWNQREFVLLPYVKDALALVSPHFRCFVVTNQPHVGLDMSVDDIIDIHAYLQYEVPYFTEIAYCSVPGSSNYKPNHGAITMLLNKYNLSPTLRSHFIIGDRWKDILCGHNAGVTTIFVGDKYTDGGSGIYPDHHTANIYTACQLIMEKHHAGQL
jgi:D-glycero-D-manno-heptose 1,7-bisphosphate phosphatase